MEKQKGNEKVKSKPRILLGDDSQEIRVSYKRSLRNFEIDEASTSLELIEKARQVGLYRIILTDNDYGDGIGGIEAIARIRKFDGETPILLQSADINLEKIKMGEEAGADYVIAKDLLQLKKILDQYKA